MELKYSLFKNQLTEDDKDYTARLQEVKTADIEVLIQEMVVPGGVTETQLRAVLAAHRNTILRLLRLGFAVNDGLIKIYPGISGVFEGEDDLFDPVRHKVKVHANPTKELRNALISADMVRVKPSSNTPEILVFEDYKTKKKDKVFTAGKMAKIKGKNICFEEDQANQGIFFIDKDQNETRIEDYAEVKPSSIIFLTPDSLADGDYEIVLRDRKSPIDRLRSTTFENLIRKA